MRRVVHVGDVNDCGPRFQARRIVLPSCGIESWTLIGPDLRPVAVVDEFLAWLTHVERSPNTVEAYARDLKAFWSFLDERGRSWDRVDVGTLAEFAAWARRPAHNVVVLAEEAARRSARTVHRMLTGVALGASHCRRASHRRGPAPGRPRPRPDAVR